MESESGMHLVYRPLDLTVPGNGVMFAESAHAPQFAMQERSDAFYKLIYVLEGRVRFEAEGFEPRELGKGAFFTVSINSTHRIEDLVPSTLLLLGLGKQFVEADVQRHLVWQRALENYRNGLVPFGLLSQEISSAWKGAVLEFMGVRFGWEVSVRTTATRILLMLSRISEDGQEASGSPSKARIRSFISALDERFYEEWNLDQASAAVRLSRKQFTKVFKELTGMTFLGKLTQLRLAHACSLLAKTDQSVISIAFSCGYQDLSHFYRLFKRAYGISPIKWRSALEAVENFDV